MIERQQHLCVGPVNTVNTAAAHKIQNADREETTLLTTGSAVGVTKISMKYYNATAVSRFGCTGRQLPLGTVGIRK